MSDKKLTDSEIVKALEICQKPHDNNTCNNCKYKRNFGCRDALCNDILDLINRLQAENERLRTQLYLEKYTDVAKKNIKAEAYKEFAGNLEKAFQKTENQMPNSEVIKQTVQICRNAIKIVSRELVGE